MGKSPIQSLIMAYILQVSHYMLGLPVVTTVILFLLLRKLKVVLSHLSARAELGVSWQYLKVQVCA